ncbi:MAG: hypothetical protein HKL90_09460 [Elusimicrobia bacterium]|nr:hypothetical protein [Elusimicrobiota bacterium]
MTKTIFALALTPLLAAAAAAQSSEALSAAGEANLLRFQPVLQDQVRAAADLRDAQNVLQPALQPRAVSPFQTNSVLTSVNLPSLLDRNLHVLTGQFGAGNKDMGLATDAGFKSFYFTFTDARGTILSPIGNPRDLINNGVDARVDSQSTYTMSVSIDIFNPVRGSTFQMTPDGNSPGQTYSMNTGQLLDDVRARAAVFSTNGVEYWLFYGRDARAGGGFAGTRSLLFVHEDGTSTKAWPLAQSALKPGVPASVNLGGNVVVVTLNGATLTVSQ